MVDLDRRQRLLHFERPPDAIAPGEQAREDMEAGIGDRDALVEQDIEHHVAAREHLLQAGTSRKLHVRVDHISHPGAALAVHDEHAGDRHGVSIGIDSEECAGLGPRRRSSISSSPNSIVTPSLPGQLGVRDELLQALVEAAGGRSSDVEFRCPGGARSRRSPRGAEGRCAACRVRCRGAPTAPARAADARPAGGGRWPARCAGRPRRCPPARAWPPWWRPRISPSLITVEILDPPPEAQNRPTVRPSASMSTLRAAGALPSPGICWMSPHSGTSQPAPV